MRTLIVPAMLALTFATQAAIVVFVDDALARQVREMKDRVKNRKARSAPRRVPASARTGAPPTE